MAVAVVAAEAAVAESLDLLEQYSVMYSE